MGPALESDMQTPLSENSRIFFLFQKMRNVLKRKQKQLIQKC